MSNAARHEATGKRSTGRHWMWPGLVFVLLGMNMVVVAITVVAAHKSRTPVVADAYSKALRWDELRAKEKGEETRD